MSNTLPIICKITRGPHYHWFGYYDKLQIDPTGRYALGMEVDFEHRSPRPDDVIQIGMVDLDAGDRWTAWGESRAWCWQQGCMLQWRPGSRSEIIWNDRQEHQFVCHILDIRTGEQRTLPFPIYTLSPDGRTAFWTDFRRINDLRPGYGYAGIPDPNRDVRAPDDVGIWRGDLETGTCELIVSIADIAALPYPHGDLQGVTHYFNHLLVNPNGTRLEFLHRWRVEGQRGFGTRMLTVGVDGEDVHVVDDYGYTSHFIWRDPEHILAWAYHPSHESSFYLYKDVDLASAAGHLTVVGQDVMTRNGHCSYLPGARWILNDTYPDLERQQHLYLYAPETNETLPLGYFLAPPEYKGEWRCDLHPRFSPDGTKVVIDSTHEGDGRQMYLVDLEPYF